MEGGVLPLLSLTLPLLLLLLARTAYGQGQAPQAIRSTKDAAINISLNAGPVPRVRPGGNLICYSCKLDFRKKEYEKDHPCLGRHGNLRVSEDYAVVCGPNDTFCRVERTEVNGVLTMLRRECTETCYRGCRLRGFGINVELCEICCSDDKCNNEYPASGATGQ